MEHVLNCHGEWAILLQALPLLALLLARLRRVMGRDTRPDTDNACDGETGD